MSTIVFTPPGKDSPGFLRRLRTATYFYEELSKEPTVKLLDDMVEFLLAFVTEPEDKDEARELLLDASEQQYFEMLGSISGKSDVDPT